MGVIRGSARVAFVLSSLLLARCALVSPADDVSIAAGGGSHQGSHNDGGLMSNTGGTHGNTDDGGLTAGSHSGGSGGASGGHGGVPGSSDAGDAGGTGGVGGNDGASGLDGGNAFDSGTDGGTSTDPCNTNNGGCDPVVACTSVGGVVACDPCPSGYDDVNGDGTSCVDIDECQGNPC
ncbi:MAG TPA: hypothetical protein VL137_16950, partial [Polyangiaceae bacterium]|nr:hypothetical protein [Polyangiaceae bacterium]